MVALLAAFALAPWLHPLTFAPLPGWQTGMSGTRHSLYVGLPGYRVNTSRESSAWIATHVRYRDAATADPPNKTLAHLPSSGVIVWAVIFNPALKGERPIRLDLSKAKHFTCCENERVIGGDYQLAGYGPGRTYSVIVRVYFGARPTSALRAKAQRALDQLRLPSS